MRWCTDKYDYITFMRNSAAKIRQWMLQYKARPIHVRVLASYHKAAWRERDITVGTGDRPLAIARSTRPRCIWEAVRSAPVKERFRAGWKQRSSGRKTAWEDMMVDFKGLFWRSERDTRDKQDWARTMDEFIDRVCTDAGLSRCAPPAAANHDAGPIGDRPSKKQRLTFKREQPEAEELTDTPAQLLRWARRTRSFLFVCDSKSVVDVLCGRARLQNEKDNPIMERITGNFVSIMSRGWTPPQLADDPVVWMPRDHNKVADGLADFTMDGAASWSKTYTTALRLPEANVIVQTDGGRRSQGCAAAAVIIGLFAIVAGQPLYEPWLAEGHFLTEAVTVFEAEAIALDIASEKVKKAIDQAERDKKTTKDETKY